MVVRAAVLPPPRLLKPNFSRSHGTSSARPGVVLHMDEVLAWAAVSLSAMGILVEGWLCQTTGSVPPQRGEDAEVLQSRGSCNLRLQTLTNFSERLLVSSFV